MSPRLLIRLPNWLGDVVACLPLVEQAERALGSALTLVAPKPWHELLAQAAPRARVIGNRSGPLDFAWRGHAQALLLDGSMRSAFQAMGAGIGVRVGLGGGGRWALRGNGAGRPSHKFDAWVDPGVHPVHLGVPRRSYWPSCPAIPRDSCRIRGPG